MKKTAIVTGASGNLGQAVIKKFLAVNFRVVGTVIPDDPVPLEFDNADFKKIVIDLANEEETSLFVKDTVSKAGIIDVAVLTVGGFASGNVNDTTLRDIQKQVKLNFDTAYNIARPVFGQMLKQGSGRIFMIGSKPGLDMRNGKGMVAYSLAKSLIFRLAEILNEEAKGTNVVTSVVVPSTIDTPQNRGSMPGKDFNTWVKPESIAGIIHFYCSDEAATLREPVIKVYNQA